MKIVVICWLHICINQFRHRLRKVIEVAGKQILNNFSRITVFGEMCDCCLSWHVQVICCHC